MVSIVWRIGGFVMGWRGLVGMVSEDWISVVRCIGDGLWCLVFGCVRILIILSFWLFSGLVMNVLGFECLLG